jgi:hypothetical protein
VVLSGDSAGAGLALALLLSLRDEGLELPPLLIQAGAGECSLRTPNYWPPARRPPGWT